MGSPDEGPGVYPLGVYMLERVLVLRSQGGLRDFRKPWWLAHGMCTSGAPCIAMMVIFILVPLSVLSAPHNSKDKPTRNDEPTATPSTMPTDMGWQWSHYSDLVSGQAEAFGRMAAELPIPSTFAEIRDMASRQASALTETTVSSARALHDALPMSEVHATLQSAIDQGKAGAEILYEALPAAEDVQSVASLSELRAGKTENVVGVLQHHWLQGYSTASEMCARLYHTLPANNAIQSRMLSGLERMRVTVPLPSSLSPSSPGGGGGGDSFGENGGDNGGSGSSNQEGGNANESHLICPFMSKSDFDMAFDEELRAVIDAQDCAVLKLASQKLLKRFGYTRLDPQQAACTNLPRRLDEYNGIVTKRTAILCAQRGQ